MSLHPTLVSKVIQEAESWLRTPYHMGAKIKGVGVDCGTFLTQVFKNAGVVSEDIQLEHFSLDWFLHTREEKYLSHILRYCSVADSPDPASVVIFRFGRIFAHGGIIIRWPLIIHAYRGGVQYADVTQPPLKGREYRIYEPISTSR